MVRREDREVDVSAAAVSSLLRHAAMVWERTGRWLRQALEKSTRGELELAGCRPDGSGRPCRILFSIMLSNTEFYAEPGLREERGRRKIINSI